MYQIIECPIILYEQYYKHNKTQPYIAKSSLDTISKKVPVNYYHDIMKDHPNIVVKIIGYQDCTENEGISKLRAEIFMKQLIKQNNKVKGEKQILFVELQLNMTNN